MQFIDSHCHIHDDQYQFDITAVLKRAEQSGVGTVICVGTDESTSQQAVKLAEEYSNVYAVVGIHPHESENKNQDIAQFMNHPKVVGVGEIGLDYFYGHASRGAQIQTFRQQLSLAIEHNLPVVFHVRDAFDDFWPIFDELTEGVKNFKGEIHSFTDNQQNLDKALKRGLYIGVNGIATFTKNEAQKAVFGAIPLDRLLLETDAPYLTPVPFRGKINEPAYILEIAEFIAQNRQLPVAKIAELTLENTKQLFNL